MPGPSQNPASPILKRVETRPPDVVNIQLPNLEVLLEKAPRAVLEATAPAISRRQVPGACQILCMHVTELLVAWGFTNELLTNGTRQWRSVSWSSLRRYFYFSICC